MKDDGQWYLVANQSTSGFSKEVLSGAKAVCIRDVVGGTQKAKAYRYNLFVSETQDLTTSEWMFSHNRIDMQAVLSATHENCPRLLFRVFSDQSMGVNTAECFKSEAFKQNEEFTPMQNMTEKQLADNLKSHINGTKKNFTSH